MKSKGLEHMHKEQTVDKEPHKDTMMFTYPQLNKTEAIQPVTVFIIHFHIEPTA